jgi:hypothetical protein
MVGGSKNQKKPFYKNREDKTDSFYLSIIGIFIVLMFIILSFYSSQHSKDQYIKSNEYRTLNNAIYSIQSKNQTIVIVELRDRAIKRNHNSTRVVNSIINETFHKKVMKSH